MATEVITTYLQMFSPEQLKPSAASGLTIVESTIVCPEFQRFLYITIGHRWYWMDRIDWTYQQWSDYLTQDHIRIWVGYLGGTPAGYFELSQEIDGSVKLIYFGLLSQFIGQGHGGFLLSEAIRQAWAWEAKRVWVHTNTLDSPQALQNYQSRGFVIYKETRAMVELPKAMDSW